MIPKHWKIYKVENKNSNIDYIIYNISLQDSKINQDKYRILYSIFDLREHCEEGMFLKEITHEEFKIDLL